MMLAGNQLIRLLFYVQVLLNQQVKSNQLATVAASDNICISQHPPLEPPGFEMLLVLLYHAVALKAAAVAQPLHDLHQPDLAV